VYKYARRAMIFVKQIQRSVFHLMIGFAGWMNLKLADELEYYVKCLIGHYSSYTVPEAGNDSRVDGDRTRYENFADQLGLTEAFFAYQEKLAVEGGAPLVEDRLPGLEMFTPAQTFFISFSHVCQ